MDTGDSVLTLNLIVISISAMIFNLISVIIFSPSDLRPYVVNLIYNLSFDLILHMAVRVKKS